MPDEKLIYLIQAKVLPDHRAELLQALRETLPLTRAEAGVELLYPTARKDDPNTLVFFRGLLLARRSRFPYATGMHKKALRSV